MPRLGELLVAARLLEAGQVERALHAQVMWGARLGTNLVELGLIDLDGLSNMLGKQHDLPVALARHFEKADASLQKLLDPAHADVLAVVPLLRVAGGKIAIASMDPLTKATRAQVAAALGVAPADLIVSIAPEQRMRYQLERVYGITRSARFLRTKGPAVTPFPKLDDEAFESEAASEVDIEIPVDVAEPIVIASATEDGAVWAQEAASELSALIDSAIDKATTPPPTGEPQGRDRRSYVRTLGDGPGAAEPKAAPGPAQAALGRIAIKKVQSAPLPVKESSGLGDTLEQAVRAIRRGPNRDRVADLAIDCLQKFAPTCAAAMIMVVRGEIAIGWKHFARDGAVSADLAVPMDQPGLVPRSAMSNETQRAPAGRLQTIDCALLQSLGREDGDLVVVPVPIAGKVMCMIAAAVDDGASVATIESIASAATAAFARLVRDSSR